MWFWCGQAERAGRETGRACALRAVEGELWSQLLQVMDTAVGVEVSCHTYAFSLRAEIVSYWLVGHTQMWWGHTCVVLWQGEDVKPSKVKLVTDVLCQAYDKLEAGSTDTAAETGE